ncbi:MAG: hypothetical protein WKF76_10490 [Nocardioidaceae bacterium]
MAGCSVASRVGPARPVLLLALEDGDRRLQDRARELLADDAIPSLLSYMTRIEPNSVVQTVEAWLDTVDADAQPLVILDTFGQGDATRVARRVARTCVTTRSPAGSSASATTVPAWRCIVLHHDRKAQSDDFVDGVPAPTESPGRVDTIIVIAASHATRVKVCSRSRAATCPSGSTPSVSTAASGP